MERGNYQYLYVDRLKKKIERKNSVRKASKQNKFLNSTPETSSIWRNFSYNIELALVLEPFEKMKI